MIVYRLSKGLYRNDLSGKGAEIAGGRWNSKGVPMVYTGESKALCATELAVHLPLGIVPVDYWLIEIRIPDTASTLEVDVAALPTGWNGYPHPDFTQTMGDAFIRDGNYLVMKVPSAVIQGDHNYLINPLHKHAGKVQVISSISFPFDERLFIR